MDLYTDMSKVFLSTPSARRATWEHWKEFMGENNFYPRPPRGGRLCGVVGHGCILLFLSTPSARRATPRVLAALRSDFYFYPRPPRGGRPTTPERFQSHKKAFLSTPSARRATRSMSSRTSSTAYFYPRPPRGGRLFFYTIKTVKPQISIHALREEGDFWSSASVCGPSVFLSTPSARRATEVAQTVLPIISISIHALREEGDNRHPSTAGCLSNFYPRPPRGGRRKPPSPSAVSS